MILSELDFVHARLFDRRQQHEVLLSDHLGVDVLVVVAVQGCGGARVAEPEVYCVGALGEGDAGPGDVGGNVGKEGAVLGAEVVVFCFGNGGFELGCFVLRRVPEWRK